MKCISVQHSLPKKREDVKRNTDMNKVNALKNAAEGGDAWS